jgi:hypothetical protein
VADDPTRIAANTDSVCVATVAPPLLGDHVMAKSESTGKKVASAAAKVLKNKASSPAEKAVAASALTQTKSKSEETSKAVASKAGKILHDPKASAAAKSVAASALTQKAAKKK